MEDKIHELQATNDDLQSMEVKVREFQESLSTISMTYDRLDKKAEVINRVSLDVDTSFNQLKEMEQRLSFCSRQMQSLPEEIKDVQTNVDTLMKNSKLSPLTSSSNICGYIDNIPISSLKLE